MHDSGRGTGLLESAAPEESTTGAPAIDRLRGMRAALLLLGGMSGAMALTAFVLWLTRMDSRGGGYNCKITAMLAAGHAVLCWAAGGVLGAAARRGAGTRVRHGLLVGVVLFVTFGVYIDIAGGLKWRRRPARQTPFESSPASVWRMRPDYTGLFSGVELRTNSDGHRSPEIALDKPPGTRRIVCLGDSLTFGHGLEERFSFPRALERSLQERLGDRTWQVINTGVPGFCTFQETEELKRTLKYQPDGAILLICLNDITEKYLAHKRFGGTGLGYQGVADGTTGLLFHLMVRLRPYSSLVTAATPTRVEAERRQAYQIKNLWEQPELPEIQEAWRQAERELDDLVAICRSNDVALMIAVAPVKAQLSMGAACELPQERLRRYSQAQGVAFIDLKPCLLKAAERLDVAPETMFMDQTHLTVNGSDAVSSCLAGLMEAAAPDEALRRWRERAMGLTP